LQATSPSKIRMADSASAPKTTTKALESPAAPEVQASAEEKAPAGPRLKEGVNDDGHVSRLASNVMFVNGRPVRSKYHHAWHNRMFDQGRAANAEDVKKLKARMHARVLDSMALETGRRGKTVEAGMVRVSDRVLKTNMNEPFVYAGMKYVAPKDFKQAAGLSGYPAPDNMRDGRFVGVFRVDPEKVAKPSYPPGVRPAAGQRVRQLPYEVSVSRCLQPKSKRANA